VSRVTQGLEAATFAQKRALVELLIDRVVVTEDDVEMRYVIPTTERSEHTRFYQLRLAYCREIPPELHGGVSAGRAALDGRGGANGDGGVP
jgi:site-specific DNA recombinase